MALSMEEQRILMQIEVRLSEDDPRLAHRLSRLGEDRTGHRVRVVAVVVVTAIVVLAAVGGAVAAAMS
ncbi:DUF3040 domain-containing protein [Actinomadura graeca]|uniref:DUF3040 domain-containing protein n=1 Tax=Actinomadura graeca TaxID=2750812 RepID=A0ABX8QQC0_9ACTN|nr:DUF3040 domain-containing protein [Actinomadura graeca]QXJ19587.1 DUF3040 domain-containing protein [Actinomadura graeca]